MEVKKKTATKDDAKLATFAIQSLMFNHPLYANAEETIKVLVLGFGFNGQKFLDICLQSGQVKGKRLDITIVTQDKERYKKQYRSLSDSRRFPLHCGSW